MTHESGFGDYIVFVDESGDQSLTSIDANYPMFVLSFCIFRKEHYAEYVVPQMVRLKFDFFGSDIPIMHETEMRKRSGDFAFLNDRSRAEEFYSRLNTLMEDAEYTIQSVAIDKRKLLASYRDCAMSPYDIAAQFGIERVFYELQSHGQRGKATPVIFECRGKKEDKALRGTLNDLLASPDIRGMSETIRPMWAPKSMNLVGLQFADMTARPIGVHCLRPGQDNRAWDIIKGKLRRSSTGMVNGYGLKVFPNM